VNTPYEANEADRLDFGSGWQQGILTIMPPKVGSAFPVLAPQVDRDGNELDGIRLREMTVPLATVTG
jgi:glutaminase